MKHHRLHSHIVIYQIFIQSNLHSRKIKHKRDQCDVEYCSMSRETYCKYLSTVLQSVKESKQDSCNCFSCREHFKDHW